MQRSADRCYRRVGDGGALISASRGSSPYLYGAPYVDAAPAFAVLSLALPLFFLNYALTHQVIGWDGQRAYLAIVAAALVANVVGNIALMPSQGMAGAAIATVLTELVVTAGCVSRSARATSAEAHRASRGGNDGRPSHVAVSAGAVVFAVGDLRRALRLPAHPSTAPRSIDVVADEDTIVRWWRSGPLLQAAVDYRDGLFFPRGRGDLALTRARREALSRQMLERDGRILSLVSAMPFVRMVALSGSLAHLNAEGVADLDLFVITAPGASGASR